MNRKLLLISIALFGVAIAVRLPSLEMDPPSWLSWSAGLFSDEGIYANDARLWAIFHSHMRGDFHSAEIAPLQNLVDIFVFHHFGVSLISLRMISVVFSIATLIIFWMALQLWYDLRTATIALGILSISAPFVLYNRMGLLETPAVFWLALTFFTIAVARSIPKRAMPVMAIVGLSAGIAIIWKGTFALAALPMLGYVVWQFKRDSLAAVGAFLGTMTIYGAVWYAPHVNELARVGHYYLVHQYLPPSFIRVLANIGRGLFTGDDDGLLPYMLCFNWFVLAVGAMFIDRTHRDPYDLLLWLWLGVPSVTFLLSDYTPSRYYMILWLPIAALGAKYIATLKAPVQTGVLLLGAIQASCLLGYTWINRTYTVRDDANILSKVLPRNSTIAGQFAPTICLNTSFKDFYVQQGFANDQLIYLQELPITHVLATKTDSPMSDPWVGKYRYLIYGPAGLTELPVGKKFTVKLYANSFALP